MPFFYSLDFLRPQGSLKIKNPPSHGGWRMPVEKLIIIYYNNAILMNEK